MPRALAAGLTPILCVGETEEERERGDTERKLRHQVQEALEKVPEDRLRRGRHRLRADLGDRHRPGRHARAGAGGDRASCARSSQGFDKAAGEQVRVLYGGSLKPDNAAELLALPDVDGALVGGARLDPASFAAIVGGARAPDDASRTSASSCSTAGGWRRTVPGNAVSLADTPVFDELWARTRTRR